MIQNQKKLTSMVEDQEKVIDTNGKTAVVFCRNALLYNKKKTKNKSKFLLQAL